MGKLESGMDFFEVKGWRIVCLFPVALLFRLYFATFRFKVSDEVVRWMREDKRGLIFVCWHNRLAATIEFHRRYRNKENKMVSLVSGSKDGAWLAAMFQLFGFQAARGSEGRRASGGAREMLKVVKAGFDTGFAVDGSKGPVYVAKEGAALIALLAKAPIVIVGPVYEKAWRIKSWDKFYIPKPFCRVEFRAELLESYEDFGVGRDRQAITTAMTRRMRGIVAGTDPDLGL